MTLMTTPRRRLELIDEEMLLSIPQGRYAWQPDDETPLTFIWIRDYRAGKRTGQRRVRTQHGPWYEDALLRFPEMNGRPVRYLIQDPTIEEVLIGVFCDRAGCAITYAQEKGLCARCGVELTDKRSRWYGIGPECEKYWSWFIEEVNNRKGYTFEQRGYHGESWE